MSSSGGGSGGGGGGDTGGGDGDGGGDIEEGLEPKSTVTISPTPSQMRSHKKPSPTSSSLLAGMDFQI
jgi:hypothetical protein